MQPGPGVSSFIRMWCINTNKIFFSLWMPLLGRSLFLVLFSNMNQERKTWYFTRRKYNSTAFILHTSIQLIFKSCCLISFCILGSFEPVYIHSVTCLTATSAASSRGPCSLLTPLLQLHQFLSQYHERYNFPKRLERIYLKGLLLPILSKRKKEREEKTCAVWAHSTVVASQCCDSWFRVWKSAFPESTAGDF